MLDELRAPSVSFSSAGAASSESSMASPTRSTCCCVAPSREAFGLGEQDRLVPPASPRPWQGGAAIFPPPGALEPVQPVPLFGLQWRRAPGSTPRLHRKPSRSGLRPARHASLPSKLTLWQGALRGNRVALTHSGSARGDRRSGRRTQTRPAPRSPFCWVWLLTAHRFPASTTDRAAPHKLYC